MALQGESGFAVWARCQDLSLWDQLNAGIRAVDIRVKFEGCGPDNQRIFHGSFDQKTNWPAVKSMLEGWITSHPTEFVLVFVANENDDRSHECSGMKMHDYLSSSLDPSKWFTTDPFTNPTYGDYKGRLVFLNSRFSNRFYNSRTQIQDQWTDVTLQQKWEAVVNHEAQARQSGKLYINMLSSAPSYANYYSTPRKVAMFINERAYNQTEIFKSGSELPYSQIEPFPTSQLSHEAVA